MAVCALLWTAAASSGLADNDAADEGIVSVGPGRVTFNLSGTGQWRALVPEWSGGASVFSTGGFVVLSGGEDGAVVELANTSVPGAGLSARKEARGLRPVYEGIPGGHRYPLLQRDDDGDGVVDEDRLDGIDNDGDGRIDEDFAAAGDEMSILSFDAVGPDGKPLFHFHQENYTWTLPHIDGMVAIKLTVRNVSGRSINDIFVGSVIRWDSPGELAVSTQGLDPMAGTEERLVSKGILVAEEGVPVVAAVFFAEPEDKNASWLTGMADGDRPLVELVQTFVDADKGIEMRDEPAAGESRGEGEEGPGEDMNGRNVYGISPNLGTLEPGEEVVVYAALVVVPEMDGVDPAIDDAYRTVVGDGTHRMVPPPVSLKRRALWGTYAVEYAGGGDAPTGVTLNLENARGHGIGAGDISYLSGIDLRRVESRELFNGDLELVLDGEMFGEIAAAGGRVELYGRLKNGEFFDLALNNVDRDKVELQVDGMSETQFWSQPGKLTPELLSGSPNPFRESTTIFYEVPSSVSDDEGGVLSLANPVSTSVKIYNVAGRLVSILVDTIVSPGQYNTSWNAVDDKGSGVASGVYYIKLQIGKKHVTKRLIQLK